MQINHVAHAREVTMRLVVPALVVAAALTMPAFAQESAVKSQGKAKADATKPMLMTGCLREDAPKHTYKLVGAPGKADEQLSAYEVELSSYVGRQVEVSVVKTDPDKATDRSKTSAGPQGKYTVVSVKPLAATCTAH
jgi:hypothetical protein